MENAILTPEVLAKRWSISLSTVARWRSEGMGPAFLKLRGHVRYRLEDIESFERQTLQSATGCKAELPNPQGDRMPKKISPPHEFTRSYERLRCGCATLPPWTL